MTRRFRGCTYEITVKTGAARRELRLDGKLMPGNLIPACGDGEIHRVLVTIPNGLQRK